MRQTTEEFLRNVSKIEFVYQETLFHMPTIVLLPNTEEKTITVLNYDSDRNTIELRKELYQLVLLSKINNWKDEYIELGILDGYSWNIAIDFKDGTDKMIFGCNKKPVNFKYFKKILRLVNDYFAMFDLA